MLVAPLVHTILFYGGFVVGVVGLACVALGGAATMRAKQQPLPPAELANRRPRNGVLWQLVGAFALIGGPAASIWLWFHTNHVVFVDDGARDGSPAIRRRVWIGSAYAAPRSLVEHPRRRATWIVNAASLPVDSVDHVGPDDPPPGVVTVTRAKEVADAGIPASARRVWLTWEPPAPPRE